ncbi:MAG TPA: alpha-L-fucosidase, partial [Phycisphaerae bacterium]|nr:alpha-L-fucosidase [Phycisphaerae bacterium]
MPSPDIYPDTVTHLYTKNRTAVEGAVEMYYYELYGMWSGTGTMTLETNVQAAGKYELALCCSVLVDSVDVRVEIAGQAATVTAGRTWGAWIDEGKLDYNFERVCVPGALDLPEGPVRIKVSLTGSCCAAKRCFAEQDEMPKKAFNLVSIELTPVAAKKAIAKAEKEGLKYKSSGDWFVEAGYGLMFHWADGTPMPDGRKKPYAQAVADFDVEKWAEMVEDTGARYAFLTANHGLPHFPAPLKYWETIHPGRTTKRDLIADMIEALGRRNIRMACYLNCPTFGGLKTKGPALEEYFDLNYRMFEEVGGRYG